MGALLPARKLERFIASYQNNEPKAILCATFGITPHGFKRLQRQLKLQLRRPGRKASLTLAEQQYVLANAKTQSPRELADRFNTSERTIRRVLRDKRPKIITYICEVCGGKSEGVSIHWNCERRGR